MSRTWRNKRPKFKRGETPVNKDGKFRDGSPQHYAKSCENHGGCPHCLGNRTHKHKKQEPLIEEDDQQDLYSKEEREILERYGFLINGHEFIKTIDDPPDKLIIEYNFLETLSDYLYDLKFQLSHDKEFIKRLDLSISKCEKLLNNAKSFEVTCSKCGIQESCQ